MKYELFKKIEELYVRAVLADFKHPRDLAATLEGLSNDAWDEVDECLTMTPVNNSSD
ncbi:hypothetical protein [Nostoc sp. PCC 7107]|uniref:hypothetical protein n=1 Tax=Nostoc sp. PCC 7107 TaxID=317936 RepID=UPI00029ED954|nr:hypothetical protein [Nostoc sp. PCC 7107]AFY43752.1 hypothetical protein Nos7107_3162 [Nostoc sp. PCC 7107]